WPACQTCWFAPNICLWLPELWAVMRSSSQLSLTSHFNRSVDRVFEVVSVVGVSLVSIADVHAIVAGAQLAQSEPEMTRNRFGFLERHEDSKGMSQGIRSVLRTAARYECLPTTFGAKGLAMSRTIKHMNPPAAVPHIARADT